MNKKRLASHFQYGWIGYVAIAAAVILIWLMLFGFVGKVPTGQRLNVSVFGKEFNAEKLATDLTDGNVFSENKPMKISVQTEYDENKNMLLYTLGVRAVGETDVIIIEEQYLSENFGHTYFSEISKDIAEKYFGGKELYSEDGDLFGVLVYDGYEQNNFTKYYGGEERCYAFITGGCRTAGTINGGLEGNDAAFDLILFLMGNSNV